MRTAKWSPAVSARMMFLGDEDHGESPTPGLQDDAQNMCRLLDAERLRGIVDNEHSSAEMNGTGDGERRAFTTRQPADKPVAVIDAGNAERLLAQHPDLAGPYVSGGGMSGALAALRDSGRARQIVTIGYDLTDVARAALLDGTINFLISHPLQTLAQ